MARRRLRKRRGGEFSLNLDSFIDIMTNCIGVVMFITIFAIINSQNLTFIVRTPFVHKTQKAPVFFECRDNRVIFVDKEAIARDVDAYFNEIKLKGISLDKLRESPSMELREVGNEYYKVDMKHLLRENIMQLVPKQRDLGEDAKKIVQSGSLFANILNTVDKDGQFVFFIVRPDSYDIFRAARKAFWKKKIEVGWEPLPKGQYVAFSSRGRMPTMQ